MQYRMKSSLAPAAIMLAVVLSGSLAATAQVLGPPPQAQAPQTAAAPGAAPFDARAALESLQLRPVGPLIRKKRHMEIDAAMADGRRVVVSFDLSGRLWEIEHAEHDKRRYGDGPVNTTAAMEAVRNAGFSNPTVRETKRHHTVVSATTRKGEPVELHVDQGGVIYKQVWVR